MSFLALYITDLCAVYLFLNLVWQLATWLELKDRLIPNGRFMVNCGGINAESDIINGRSHPKSVDSTWVENSTILALSKAFPGHVCHFLIFINL